MLSKLHWRRSMMASCLVHCLIFIGAGWLNAHISDASRAPEYIEMELISDPGAAEQTAGPPAEQTPAAPAAKPVVMPAVAQVARPLVRTVTSDEVAERYVPEQNAGPAASGINADAAVPAMAAPDGSGAGYGSSGTGSGNSGTASGGPQKILRPRLLQEVEPIYPEEARRDGLSGEVTVKIEVQESGRPGEIWVERSSGYRVLDEAALQTARKYRFVPAQEADSGRAVRCLSSRTIVFRIKN